MSTDQSHLDSQPFDRSPLLKKSHRTRPEQMVGLGIFLLLSLSTEVFFPMSPSVLGAAYSLLLALSMWILWRAHSLRVLKIELSVFLFALCLQIFWSASFFLMKHNLMALVALLLLWCNVLLTCALFWKKEKVSGILLLFPLIWVFYLVGLNMFRCMG